MTFGAGVVKKYILCSYADLAGHKISLEKLSVHWQLGEAEAAAEEYLRKTEGGQIVILTELVRSQSSY